MQEAFGLLDPVAVDHHPDDPDPERVHQHRQRGRRQQQHRLVPHRSAVEDRKQIGKGQDREQVAQPRTGLGHLQLVDAQINDIAFQEHRNAHQRDEPDPQFRRDALQEDRQLPVDELRQRQHEDQMHHGQKVPLALDPAKTGQHHAAGPEDQRIGDDVGDLHEVAEDPQHQREQDQQDARPPVRRGPRGGRGCRAQLAQKEIERDQRNERPMAVFRRRPGAPKGQNSDPEHRQRCRHQHHKPAKSNRIQDDRPGGRRGTLCRRHRKTTFHAKSKPKKNVLLQDGALFPAAQP